MHLKINELCKNKAIVCKGGKKHITCEPGIMWKNESIENQNVCKKKKKKKKRNKPALKLIVKRK